MSNSLLALKSDKFFFFLRTVHKILFIAKALFLNISARRILSVPIMVIKSWVSRQNVSRYLFFFF